jgi:hypothetical protein
MFENHQASLDMFSALLTPEIIAVFLQTLAWPDEWSRQTDLT